MSTIFKGNYNPQRSPLLVQAHIRALMRARDEGHIRDVTAEGQKFIAMDHLREEYVHDKDFEQRPEDERNHIHIGVRR